MISKKKLFKLRDILKFFFKPKEKTTHYEDIKLPDDFPFELRVEPDSKKIITLPKWVAGTIPLLKIGYNHLVKKNSDQSDQKDSNLIQNLVKLSKENPCQTKENFDFEIQDILNLSKDFGHFLVTFLTFWSFSWKLLSVHQ